MSKFILLALFTILSAQVVAQIPVPQPSLKITENIQIDPSLHLDALYDTDAEAYEISGLEPSLSLRTPYIDAFANWHLSYFEDEGEWEDESEEAFVKLHDLPGLPEDFTVRGGRFFNRFGHRNAIHPHGWDWRDQTLVNQRFIGDEGLTTEGGEISFRLPGQSRFVTTASIAFGDARAHDHGHGEEDDHGHGDEDDDEHHDDDDEHDGEDGEHHDDDEDEHHDDDEHDDDGDEHGHDDEDEHGHEELDPDELGFANELVTIRLHTRYNLNDFKRIEGGISHAIGEMESGDDLNTTGAHVSYTWRENGFEAGGQSLRWVTELMLRDLDLDEVGSQKELGGYSQASYRFSNFAEAGLRFGYTEGIDEIELPSQWRISPRVTFYPLQSRILRLHAQFNHTDTEEEGDEQTVLLGLSASLGAPEVR